VGQGGPVGMVFGYGVVDVQALEEMIEEGIL